MSIHGYLTGISSRHAKASRKRLRKSTGKGAKFRMNNYKGFVRELDTEGNPIPQETLTSHKMTAKEREAYLVEKFREENRLKKELESGGETE